VDTGDAGAGADTQRRFLRPNRHRANRGAQTINEIGDLFIATSLDDDPEFVAAETGQQRAVAHDAAHGLCDITQDPIPGQMAGGVVHRLETVEIDEDQMAAGLVILLRRFDHFGQGIVQSALMPIPRIRIAAGFR